MYGKRELKSVEPVAGHILPVGIANISHMIIYRRAYTVGLFVYCREGK
jgi:hypothetical protein